MTTSAVIFVGLGSLTECAEIDRNAWNAAFRGVGLRWDWSWDTYSELMRHGGDRGLAARFAEFVGTDIDCDRLEAAHQRGFAARMTGDAPLRAGVAETLKWAMQHRAGLALVSRHGPAAVYPVLTATARARGGIEFDTVITKADRLRPAPHPDTIQAAKEALGAQEALVIADTPAGAAAGLDAGLQTLAFPGRLAEEWHFPTGVIGPAKLSPELIADVLGWPTRAAAE